MLQVMRDIGGVEIPTSLAKLVGEDGATADGNGQANGAERTAAAEAAESKAPPAKPRA